MRTLLINNYLQGHPMKKLFITFILSLSINANLSAEELSFGEPVNMELIQPLEQIMAEPNNFVDKEVTIKGKIEKVCKKKGCWADFVADDKRLRVKVADGEIVIPMHTIGKEAYATGTLHATDLSKEQTIAYLQHMADDAGEKFDPSTIHQGITLYQLESDSVKICLDLK